MKDVNVLFHYHVWATDKLLTFIEENCPGLFEKELKSVFPSISETVSHMLNVDQLWFKRIKGSLKERSNVFSTVIEAKVLFTEVHREMAEFLNEADFENAIVYKTSEGEEFVNPLSDLIVHIVNHGTYHRGNITAMLHSLGHKGVSTDYIYFLREQKRS